MIAGGIVGFRQGGWLGLALGSLAGFAVVVALVGGVGLVVALLGKRK